jgi:hypothetical protein
MLWMQIATSVGPAEVSLQEALAVVQIYKALGKGSQ